MKYKVIILLFLALLAFAIVKLIIGVPSRSNDKKSAEKIDCTNVKGYEDWILSGSETLEKKPSVGHYTISRHNVRSKDKDYSIYRVGCNETDVEAYMVWNGVFIYTEGGFSDTRLIDEYAGVSEVSDINNDGYHEVVVNIGTAGNCWSCMRKEIIQLIDGVAVNLTEKINDFNKGAVITVEDLDDNYSEKELIFRESKWEFAFGLCHACSYRTLRIYKWDGDSYQDESISYPSFYEKELSEAMQYWNEWGCGKPNISTSPDSCLGVALPVLLASDMLGKRDEGWQFFWNNTNPELFKRHENFDYASEIFERARSTLERQYKNGEPFKPGARY